MSAIKVVMLLGLAAISTSGCHMFEDPNNLNSCPVGDGYPCSCDIDEGPLCDDNNRCYAVNEDFRGFCTQRCSVPSDCLGTRNFGLEGVCGLSINTPDRPDHCLVVCDDGRSHAECPPGQTCEWQENLGYSVCLPRASD
jgi:hypothetical protein